MFTGLFSLGRRTGVAVALIVALLASSVSPAATREAPGKTKAAAGLQRKPAKAKVKAKVKPAPAAPPSEPERSEAANRLLAWVAAERDNGKHPFIVIDKENASLSLYRANGEFVGHAPVLLGMGAGDDSSPGVGAKSLSEIGPAERTTPAGRFVAKFGRAFGGQRVLWVDYANSVALHAVITTNRKERRVARLRSATPDDNRVTFGCINVATSFYNKQVRPLFQKSGGVVYILPDTKAMDDVFPRLRLLPYLSASSN